MVIERVLMVLLLILSALSGLSQTESDVNISQGGYGMVKTNIGLSYSRGFSTVRDGYDSRVSYEMVRSRAFTLTANARYSSVNVDFGDDDISEGYDPDAINLNGTHAMGTVGLTSMLYMRAFGKPLVGMAMGSCEWGAGGFAQGRRKGGIQFQCGGRVLLRRPGRHAADARHSPLSGRDRFL